MDVSDSMLLGQHALAYVIATYGAQVLRVRVLSFPMLEQTLHVLGHHRWRDRRDRCC